MWDHLLGALAAYKRIIASCANIVLSFLMRCLSRKNEGEFLAKFYHILNHQHGTISFVFFSLELLMSF